MTTVPAASELFDALPAIPGEFPLTPSSNHVELTQEERAQIEIDQSEDVVRNADGSVNWPETLGPKKLSHRHRFIAHLAALGFPQKEIALRAGYTQGRLSLVINTPIVQAEINFVRKEIFSKDPDQALRTMLPEALLVINDVLKNPQEKSALRTDVAFRLLERTHGKPKQQIDVSGSMLKDVFALLDARERGMREVQNTINVDGEARDSVDTESVGGSDSDTSDALILPEEKDPYDRYLDQVLPTKDSQGA